MLLFFVKKSFVCLTEHQRFIAHETFANYGTYTCTSTYAKGKLIYLPITMLSVDVLEEPYSVSCSTTPTSFHNK